jgi:hypothetical protein
VAMAMRPLGAAPPSQEPGQGCAPLPSGSAASRRRRPPSGRRPGGPSRSARPTPSLGNSLLPRRWLGQRPLKEHRRSGPLYALAGFPLWILCALTIYNCKVLTCVYISFFSPCVI